MKNTLTLLVLLIAATLRSQSYDNLTRQLDSILHQYNIPGAQAVIVSKDSILWQQNFGYADLAGKQPVSDETLFRIGSITKSFVAVSAMMLAEEGRISLEDKVEDLAPELPFTNSWESTHPVRFVHLLEHTAGFDDMHLLEYATQGEGWSTLQGLTFHPHSKISRWKPGTHMSYCNSGPQMAAFCIEKKTGKKIEDFIGERIFGPLGMTNSSLLPTDYVKSKLSKGYLGEDNEEAPYWHITGRSAGAINSNATEMAAYLRFFLNRGRKDTVALLKPASIDRIEHPQSTLAAKAGITEGYGLHIANSTFRGVKICGHSGGMSGFLAMLRYAPEKGIGYILLINKSGDGFGQLNDALTQFITDPDNQWKMPEHQPGEYNPEFTGYYRSATSRNEVIRFMEWLPGVLQIKEKDGLLFYKPLFGEEEPLNVEKPDVLQYYSKKGGGVKLALLKDDDGRTILQEAANGGNYYKTTPAAVWLSLGLAVFSQVMVLFAIIAALVWIPISIFGKNRIAYKRARIYPLLAGLSWVGFVLFITLAQTQGDVLMNLGKASVWSVGMFVFSLLVPIFSLFAVYYNFKSFGKPVNKWARVFFTLSSLGCLLISGYLVYWGVAGLRIWVY